MTDPQPIIAAVCRKHFVTESRLLSEFNPSGVKSARYELAYRLATETGMTLDQIGRVMNAAPLHVENMVNAMGGRKRAAA